MHTHIHEDIEIDGDWFTVSTYDHPQFGWYVSVDDEVAWDKDVLLDQLAEALIDAPAVTAAFREDREVILVAGSIDGDDLAAWITDWWNERR